MDSEIFKIIEQFSWTIFGVVFIFASIASLILNHHWMKYGVRLESLKRVKRLYFSVTGGLLAGMFVLLLLI